MSPQQNWQKKGLVFSPSGHLAWARKNASFPTVEVLQDRYRVYFTSLDQQNIGRVGFVDLNKLDPTQIITECIMPLIGIGKTGTFDDHGANAFSICNVQGKRYLYYQGWKLDSKIPYYIFSNLAICEKDLDFKKISETPVLGKTESDPLMRAAPFVLFDEGKFKIWYCSCSQWVLQNERWDYRLSMKYLESRDGINWSGEPREVMTYSDPGDFAVGRPCVVKHSGKYLMWYSIRSFTRPYRLGFATSADGIEWRRQDDLINLTHSTSGWDSEMICYPYVFKDQGRWHMFYNGNGHGASGFGYAICEDTF